MSSSQSFTRIDLLYLTQELINHSPYKEELAKAHEKIHNLEKNCNKKVGVTINNKVSRLFVAELLRTLDNCNVITEFENTYEILEYFKRDSLGLDLIYMDDDNSREEEVSNSIAEIRKFEKGSSGGGTPVQIIVLTDSFERKAKYLFIGANRVLVRNF